MWGLCIRGTTTTTSAAASIHHKSIDVKNNIYELQTYLELSVFLPIIYCYILAAFFEEMRFFGISLNYCELT